MLKLPLAFDSSWRLMSFLMSSSYLVVPATPESLIKTWFSAMHTFALVKCSINDRIAWKRNIHSSISNGCEPEFSEKSRKHTIFLVWFLLCPQYFPQNLHEWQCLSLIIYKIGEFHLFLISKLIQSNKKEKRFSNIINSY